MSFEIEALERVWLAQPTQPIEVDIKSVRRAARRLTWKVRIRNASEWAASLAIAFIFIPKALESSLPMISRVSCAAIVGAAIYISWRLFRDGRNRVAPNVEDDTDAYVRAYHDNLVGQAEMLARVPQWYLAPMGVGIGGFYVGQLLNSPQRWLTILLALGFTVLVFVLIGVLNHRAAAKLRARAKALSHRS